MRNRRRKSRGWNEQLLLDKQKEGKVRALLVSHGPQLGLFQAEPQAPVPDSEALREQRRKAREYEAELQIRCVRWFALFYPSYVKLLHHSPNGGKRSKREAKKFKRMGTRAGFPDLVLSVPRGSYPGLYLELKYEKNGLTERQREMQIALLEQGYQYVVIRTLDEFVGTIDTYFKLPKYEPRPSAILSTPQ